MIKKIKFILPAILTGLLCHSCSQKVTVTNSPTYVPGPRCIVYKTRADYNQNVPVMLSADRLEIVSYPDVRDIITNGQYSYPNRLEGGYLLDNRGIGPDVAFLKWTYAEYAAFDATPPVEEILRNIIDRDPLLEMYDCGSRNQYAFPADVMISLIRSGGLAKQKRIK